MQTTNNKLATIIAELDTLESHRRAMLDEYMPIKNRIVELTEEKEKLEEELLSEEQVETDARFDKVIESMKSEQKLHEYAKQKRIDMGLDKKITPDEENQLIDEIKNPEDYADFDTKDLESSIA